MYESRTYDHHGDPVVVLVTTGTHDVSRLVHLLARGLVEHVSLSKFVLRQVRRHNGGRAALQLLAAHGGPDLLFNGTADPASWMTWVAEQYRQCIVSARVTCDAGHYEKVNGRAEAYRQAAEHLAPLIGVEPPDWDAIRRDVPADGIYRPAPAAAAIGEAPAR